MTSTVGNWTRLRSNTDAMNASRPGTPDDEASLNETLTGVTGGVGRPVPSVLQGTTASSWAAQMEMTSRLSGARSISSSTALCSLRGQRGRGGAPTHRMGISEAG